MSQKNNAVSSEVSKPFDKEKKSIEVLVALSEKSDLFNARVNSLEDQFAKLKSAFSVVEDLKNDFSSLKSESLASSDDLNKKVLSFESLLKEYAKRIDDVGIDFVSFEKSLKDLQIQVSNFEKNHAEVLCRMMERISENRDLFVKKVDYETFEGLVVQKIESHLKDFKSHKNLLDKFSAQTMSLHDVSSAIVSRMEYLEESAKESEKSLAKHMGSYFEKLTQFSERVEKKFSEIHQQVHASLEKAKSEFQASPSSVDSIRKDFEKQIELMKMDASNACLKATNAETQLRVLDRKIENAHLLIKKLELTE